MLNSRKRGNVKILGLSLLLMLSIFVMSGLTFATSEYGSAAALNTSEYTLEEMLLYAIQDEYAALTEYQMIMETFDVTRPFSNIADSEVRHIEWLVPLFETYGIEVPENTADEFVVIPDSLTESYEIGVTAEINNIAMYDAFLSQELPSDVEAVFESLRAGSENHLAAFQRQVDNSTTGQGMQNAGNGSNNRSQNASQNGNQSGLQNGLRLGNQNGFRNAK